MASESDRYVELVAKLLELTQEGTLKWSSRPPRASLNSDPERAVDIVYTAQYKGKTLGLYMVRRKFETSGTGSFFSGLTGTSGYSGFYGPNPPKWVYEPILEFIDGAGNSVWTFPLVSGLSDLLSAVRYQAAGVSQFLDDVLGKK